MVVRGGREEMDVGIRDEIEKLNRRFGEGIRRGDAAAVSILYTKDAILMPPNFEAIRGREGTQRFWEGAIKMGVRNAILKTEEIHKKGARVEEIGSYTLKIHPEGQDPFEDRGKYVVLWKQDAGGDWRLHRDIWNSSLPLKK
jgi:ketosteroid isomerase-like protein